MTLPSNSLAGGNKTRIWTLLILLFFVSRFILILWGYQSIPAIEGQEQGYIGIELLSGLRAPLIDYQVDTYSGGTLLFGPLTAPFIYFFGLSAFSLKMMSLFTSFLTFACVIFFMKRFFGQRTALYAALLWIFAPPVITINSLLSLGSHECLFPILGFLFSFCLYLSETKPKVRTFSLIGTGFFAGLALTFSYISLVAFATATGLISYLIYTKRLKFSLLEGFIFLGAFAIGGLEWLTYNATHGFVGIHYLIHSTVADSRKPRLTILMELLRFFTRVLPYGLSFESLPGLTRRSITNYSYFAIPVLIIFNGLRKTLSLPRHERRPSHPMHFFASYLMIYPIFYVFSTYWFQPMPNATAWDYRYLTPYFAFGILCFSALLARLRFRKLILIYLLAFGFFSQIATAWNKPFGEVFRPLAFKSGLSNYMWRHPFRLNFRTTKDFEKYLEGLKNKNTFDRHTTLAKVANDPDFWDLGPPEKIVEFILKISDKNYRRYFFRMWGISLEADHDNPATLETFKRILRVTPEAYQEDFVFGFARGIHSDSNPSPLIKFIEAAGPQNAPMFYMALGNNYFRNMRNENDVAAPEFKIDSSPLVESGKAWFYRGIGSAMYRSFRFQEILQKNLAFLRPVVPPKHQNDLYWGIGWYLARRYFYEPQRGIEKLAMLNLPERNSARDGFLYFHSLNHNFNHSN